MTLEVPLTIQPMEAAPVNDLPAGQRWLFEPKYDGFRCVLFRDGDSVNLQSRRQRPLGRYFPEIIEAARQLPIKQYVFDGELIIPDQPFDTLQLRLHPAASRVQLLSRQHPAQIVVFDLLAHEHGRSLLDKPFSDRRAALEAAFRQIGRNANFVLSKATTSRDTARGWLTHLGHGLDGIVAKRLDLPYRPGERAMQKYKLLADLGLRGRRHLLQGRHAVGRISTDGPVRQRRPAELRRPVRYRQQWPGNRQAAETADWRFGIYRQCARRHEPMVRSRAQACSIATEARGGGERGSY